MSEPASARRSLGDLWLPAAVGLAGVLVSLLFWGLLVGERRDHLLAATSDVVAESREGLELELERQLEALRGLADLWGRFGVPSAPEWREDVGQRVSRSAGMVALAWIDGRSARPRVATARGVAPESIVLDVDRAVELGDAPRWSAPERLASGRLGYRISVPVRPSTGAGASGVLVAVFAVEPFLDHVLHGKASGFALAVDWQGEDVFALPASRRPTPGSGGGGSMRTRSCRSAGRGTWSGGPPRRWPRRA